MIAARRLWNRLESFFFPPETDTWLALLRTGLGFQIILYSWSLRRDWNYLLSDREGLISRRVSEAITSVQTPLVPKLGWFVALGNLFGLKEETILTLVWSLLLVAGCGLIFGLFCRPFAITAWFLHLCAAKSGGLVSYGVDQFMTIGLFYLMLSPLPDRYSLDQTLRKLKTKDRQWSRRALRDLDGRAVRPSERERASQLLGFFRRVLQIHLCLIYFFSGLTKSLGSGWWDGSNMWRALIRPPFNIIDPAMLVRWKHLFPVAGVLICILEIGYPFFIWHKRTRPIWLWLVIGMHIAIGITMGMYLFALIMIVLNAAAFGPDFGSRQGEKVSVREQEAFG
jgi:hypothetical protein